MNLLVSLRLQQLNSTTWWSISGTSSGHSIGSSAGSVTINDVVIFGRPLGVAMSFSRAPLAATASCNSSTPPCPGVGFVTNRYIVSGTQTVLVRRIAKTLALNILPAGDKYEGDSVTFVAYSTDNRPVSVREWIWRDTSGVTSLVPCYGASTQCRWVPPSSGMMYVRARVGTNPYIEQAARWLDLLPVEFTVSISPSPALMLIDTVSIVPQATPARPIRDLTVLLPLLTLRRATTTFETLSTPAAELSQPTCTDVPSPLCRAIAVSGGTIRIQAVVNGRVREASVAIDVEVNPDPIGECNDKVAVIANLPDESTLTCTSSSPFPVLIKSTKLLDCPQSAAGYTTVQTPSGTVGLSFSFLRQSPPRSKSWGGVVRFDVAHFKGNLWGAPPFSAAPTSASGQVWCAAGIGIFG